MGRQSIGDSFLDADLMLIVFSCKIGRGFSLELSLLRLMAIILLINFLVEESRSGRRVNAQCTVFSTIVIMRLAVASLDALECRHDGGWSARRGCLEGEYGAW